MATAMASFVSISSDSHFSLQNLPYGVFKPTLEETARPGVAIGDNVLDLSVISEAGLFTGPLLSVSDCFHQSSLNAFMAMGRPAWKEARATIQRLLSADEPTLRDNAELRSKAFFPLSDVKMELPALIGDYTDFFSSRYHASNCGKIFRGVDALPDNWLHVPIAYHGRSSSIVISGHDIVRPRGQVAPADKNSSPQHKPSDHLDFELEMAMFIGPGNELGCPITIDSALDHVFGLVLVNDWSARDIQRWEAMPLGPFLGKSFATTISPWIVSLEALEPFICDAPEQIPPPLPYLKESKRESFDIPLEVMIKGDGDEKGHVVCKSNFKHLYWTLAQQVAHHTVNGCNLRTGDLLASGTISGPSEDSLGCLLEMSWGGTKNVSVGHSRSRKFLEDGDEVIFTATCSSKDLVIGFGECKGKILPSV